MADITDYVPIVQRAGQHPNQTVQPIVSTCFSCVYVTPQLSPLSIMHTSRNSTANLDKHLSFPYCGLDETGFNNTWVRR